MRTINEQQLKDILDKHRKWLRNEKNGERANLSYVNLHSADLSAVNLRVANLMTFQFQQHTAYYTFDGSLCIGCLVMPITEWAIGFKEIGIANGYTTEQISMYGNFISMCMKHFKGSNK